MNESKNELRKIQKNLTLSLKQELNRLVGKTTKVIENYQEAYHKDFKMISAQNQIISRDQVLKVALDHQILILGDYHPYPQSQKTAIRLLRELTQSSSWVIGMEMIPSDQQKDLDQFLAGRITLEQLHRQIAYTEHWGFPWSNFVALFELAKTKKLKMLALNRPSKSLASKSLDSKNHAKKSLLSKGSASKSTTHKSFIHQQDHKKNDLQLRDQWAARIMIQHMENHPKDKIFALYGEFHLASQHLPLELYKSSTRHLGTPIKTLVIHQNNDELYWKTHSTHTESSMILKLKPSHIKLNQVPVGLIVQDLKIAEHYCIFSGTPWTKLQSLINWIEGDSLKFVDEEINEDDEVDHESEFLFWIKKYSDTLSKILKCEKAELDEITLYSFGNQDFLNALENKQKWLSKLTQSQERLYVRAEKQGHEGQAILYTPSLSENSAAELAALHLLHQETLRDPIYKIQEETFSQLIMDHAFGFFGSLIINPKRKCDFYEDHFARYKSLKKPNETSGEVALFKYELEARTGVLQCLKLIRSSRSGFYPLLRKQKYSQTALFTISRYLGQILGYALYAEFLANRIQLKKVKDLFLGEFIPISHELQVQKLIQLCSKSLWKVKSKKELL